MLWSALDRSVNGGLKSRPAIGARFRAFFVSFNHWFAPMKQIAIVQAKAKLEKARQAVAALANAKTLPEANSTWADFLHAAIGIYTKLEQGAKGSGPSNAWFGRKKHERKTDPLLRYIHQARNADEHGLEAITSVDLPTFSVGGGGTYDTKVIEGGPLPHLEITYRSGPPPQVTFTGPRLKLVRVKDDRYGDHCDPPTIHLGVAIADQSVLNVATLGLAYLEATLLEEAIRLPVVV
jgi:hypothetical protein